MGKWFKRGGTCLGFAAIVIGLAVFGAAVPVWGEIASGNAFENASWELVAEYPVESPVGVVQSVCCTDDYIICIENYDDTSTAPDVVSAYYKNSVDEAGNPVTRYTLARRVCNADYAHANGMAWNPGTNEILVSGYSSVDPENAGCIFRMDAKTLEFKERVRIAEGYNILGIDYLEDRDQYLIQTDAAGGYSFKILDSEFQVVDDWGAYSFESNGKNFQDLCVSDDYFMVFPVTINMGIGDFLEVYSISERSMVSNTPVAFGLEEQILTDEPEGLCEIEPGVFLAIVNVGCADGTRKLRMYQTCVPYRFHIKAAAEHGIFGGAGEGVLRGEDCTVRYSPEEGYELKHLVVDGQEADPTAFADGYTFSNVQSDHTMEIVFEKIPSKESDAAAIQGADEREPTAVPASAGEQKNGSSERGKIGIPITVMGKRIAAGAVSVLVLLQLCYLRIRIVRRLKRERSRKSLELRRKYYRDMVAEDEPF